MTHARSPGTAGEPRRIGRFAALLLTLALGLVVSACGAGTDASGAPLGDEPTEVPAGTAGY